jgi:hypothetical protein
MRCCDLRLCLTLTEVYARYLESPGTKAYSVAEARRLFATFSSVSTRTALTHADLLESAAGQRHGGGWLSLARAVAAGAAAPLRLFARAVPAGAGGKVMPAHALGG